jgi:hypothetical protein
VNPRIILSLLIGAISIFALIDCLVIQSTLTALGQLNPAQILVDYYHPNHLVLAKASLRPAA